MLAAVPVFAQPVASPPAALTYTHWQDLAPESSLKSAFENQGRMLINNLNLVAEGKENGTDKAVLIRGGGFTPASLDWLIKDMGVRTIIDLRGRFSDDKTNQMIALSPSVLAEYKKRHEENRLRNLSPDQTKAYVEHLAATSHLPLHYYNLKAEDPEVLKQLNMASVTQPLAMFCQHGVNRSGTAWGEYAAQHGWGFDQAMAAFGVTNGGGAYINRRDIEYGYTLEKNRLKNTSR